MPLSVGEGFAGYTILRLIGSGGMGEVYLARHPRLPREDALKVLRADVSSDDEFRQRFIREADLASALKHPNIVTVHDRGDFNGQLWIATEYVEGTDAAQLMVTKYPAGMPVEEAGAIITPIADALDYAHGKGLLHRDVKPANILLSQPDRTGKRRVFLADFGIARPMADPNGLTATNLTLGTVAYAAPEQLMGEPIDGRADEYALAATAFQLLTGGPMYEASNPVTVISKHLNSPPPAVSSRRSDLAPLDEAFTTALAKNPSDRFATCSQFASAVSDRAGLGSISGNATQYGIIPPAPAQLRRRGLHSALIAAATLTLTGIVVAAIIVVHHSKPSGVAGPTLNGTYRFDYNLNEDTMLGSPNPPPEGDPKSATAWWAFRSACTTTGCAATATKLDPENHQVALVSETALVFRFVNGQWQSDLVKDRAKSPKCSVKKGQYVAGDYTVASVRTLAPQPDGSLRGVYTETDITSECGMQGRVFESYSVATRVGEVASGVNIADPSAAVIEPRTEPGRRPPVTGPVLSGVYQLDYNRGYSTTMNGVPIQEDRPGPAVAHWWAFQSLCTATGCIATGSVLDDANHQESAGTALVLRFTNGRWEGSTGTIAVSCADLRAKAASPPPGGSGISTRYTLEPQSDGTLLGAETSTIEDDGCGMMGTALNGPFTATRTGDVPSAVILADPALFM